MTKEEKDASGKNPIVEILVGILVLGILFYFQVKDNDPLDRLVDSFQNNYPKLYLIVLGVFGIYLVIRGIKSSRKNEIHLARYRIMSGTIILLLCLMLVI